MPSIEPAPQSGASPFLQLERHAPVLPPSARPMPVPSNAGRTHAADLTDYITLGVGVAGVGALGLAAVGGIEGMAAVAAGGAVVAKNVGTAAKAFGPKIAEDAKALAERFKDAKEVGKFVAEQTSAAVGELTRATVIGAGVSGGAALTERVIHAFEPPPSAAKFVPDCDVRR